MSGRPFWTARDSLSSTIVYFLRPLRCLSQLSSWGKCCTREWRNCVREFQMMISPWMHFLLKMSCKGRVTFVFISLMMQLWGDFNFCKMFWIKRVIMIHVPVTAFTLGSDDEHVRFFLKWYWLHLCVWSCDRRLVKYKPACCLEKEKKYGVDRCCDEKHVSEGWLKRVEERLSSGDVLYHPRTAFFLKLKIAFFFFAQYLQVQTTK
jgi:hypothetical protein